MSSAAPSTPGLCLWRTARWAGRDGVGHAVWRSVPAPCPCLICVHPQIVVSLVNGRPGAMNFSYSPLLRDFTKATNIRLRFLRTNTLLGHLMGKALRDPTVTRRVSGRAGGPGFGAGVGGAPWSWSCYGRGHGGWGCYGRGHLGSGQEWEATRSRCGPCTVLLQYQGHQHRRPLCLPRACGCL